MPEIVPSKMLFFIKRLSPSIAKINNKGDRGHPCQSPLPLLKKSVASPLRKIAKVEVVTQLIIQLDKGMPKPNLMRIGLK
jgi:hypothetical protein